MVPSPHITNCISSRPLPSLPIYLPDCAVLGRRRQQRRLVGRPAQARDGARVAHQHALTSWMRWIISRQSLDMGGRKRRVIHPFIYSCDRPTDRGAERAAVVQLDLTVRQRGGHRGAVAGVGALQDVPEGQGRSG